MGHVRLMKAASDSIFLCLVSVILLPGCGSSVHDDVVRDDLNALKEKVEHDPGLIESKNVLGKTPLHYAVTFARKDAMEYLIAEGAKVGAKDGTGLTPLHVAAIVDVRGAARLLLDAGAALDERDDFGDTPLHSAAMHGSTKVLAFLVGRGADASFLNDEGLRPIDLARKHEHPESTEILAREGDPG